jgi:hypothetical protein
MRRVRVSVIVLLGFASLGVAPASQAATQVIGGTQTGLDGSQVGILSSTVQDTVAPGSPTYAVPANGALTEWRHVTRSEEQGAPMKLKVFRRTADPSAFFVVGQSSFATLTFPGPIPNSFPVTPPIQVKAGDVIGLTAIGESLGPRPAIWHPGSPGDTERAIGGSGADAPPGSNQAFLGPGIEPVRVNIAAVFDPAETISSARATPRKFAVIRGGPAETPVAASSVAQGTTFRFDLTDFATVTYSIERQFRGELKNGVCKKRKRPKKHKCRGFARVGAFASPGQPGANSHSFSGRIGKKSLSPGKYQAILTAKDAAGSVSEPATVSFKVIKPKPPRR